MVSSRVLYIQTLDLFFFLGGGGVLECSNFLTATKGPVKLIKGVKIAHSFFTVCVRSILRCQFKLAYVILQIAVKELFETDF